MKLLLRTVFASLLLLLAGSAAAAPVSYVPGHCVGPVHAVPNPSLDADQLEYAAAWWQFVDSGGANQTLFSQFHPMSTDWPLAGLQVEPFADGYALFRRIFAHKLQLDPNAGPIVDVRALVAGSDPVVSSAWREWTQYHQLTTSTAADSQAHANHKAAIIEALGPAQSWFIVGVPYYVGTTLATSSSITSDRLTTVRPAGTPVTPPLDVSEETLGTCDFGLSSRIENSKGDIANVAGLYKADVDRGQPGGPKSGFDCDDAADAWAAHFLKGGECCTTCPSGCLQAKTLFVSWTAHPKAGSAKGQGAGHKVAKVICCGHFWLVDPQTGSASGPFGADTQPNAWDLLIGAGYDIDPTQNMTTDSREIPIGERDGVEPPPWYQDDEARQHFEEKTGKSASDYTP